MNAIECITKRRSIRKYKDEVVSQAVLNEIMEVAKFAPSWANYQVARYNFISNPDLIKEISEKGVNGFVYNQATLKNAKNILVLSVVKGKSGKLDLEQSEFATSKSGVWEVFDAGIACQTFCLAAYDKGIGTCIFGVIDDESIKEIIDLPQDETVACVIAFGYPDENIATSPRKEVNEITRFK